MATNNIKLKKAVSVIVTALAALIFALAILMLVFTFVAKSKGGQAKIFGYSFSVVLTDSMTPEIKVGELVTVKHCAIDKAKVGDNAVFIAQSGAVKGQRVIHKIVEIGENEQGVYYIITCGVKAGATPDEPTYADNFVGIGVAHSVFLGGVVVFFSNWINIVCLVVFLFGIWLAVRQIRKLVKLSREESAEAPLQDGKTQGNGLSDENRKK